MHLHFRPPTPQPSPAAQQHFIPLQVVHTPLQVGSIGLGLHLYLVVPQAVQEDSMPFVQLINLCSGHSVE